MKKIIRLTESDLRRVISKSVKRVLREADNDYEGNDLDYDSIKMQAMSIIPRMHQNGQVVSWRAVAKEMGFRLETLNGEDMELLKDAIEETMMEDSYTGIDDVASPVKEAYENMIQAMEDFEASVVENMNVQNDDGRYQSLDDALTKAKYAAENIVNGGFKHPHPNAFR